MRELLNMLLGHLPAEPRSPDSVAGAGFWSDGEMILCPTEAACELIADFLQALFQNSALVVQTGYYNPLEDIRDGERDCYTGFYYISFEQIADRSDGRCLGRYR